jgi:hypothetical protein
MKLTLVALLGLNALLIAIALYGVYGAVWIWQPGATPPQWAPLFGSQSYLLSLRTKGYNCTVVYEFLTYRIEYRSGAGSVSGPAIFDWTQFSLLLLAVSDILVLVYLLRLRIGKKDNQRETSKLLDTS